MGAAFAWKHCEASSAAKVSFRRQAIIVGGGIAGLATAIGLARNGWHCSILEQSPLRIWKGHGLLLSPTGHAVLEALGVKAISSFSHRIDSFLLCNATGITLQEYAIPGSLSLLHRELLGALQQALPSGVEPIHERCIGLQGNPEDGYQVVAATGRVWGGELIVAADGVGSICHGVLFPKVRLTEDLVSELGLVVRNEPFAKRLGHSCRKFQDASAGLAVGLVPCHQGQVLIHAQIASDRYSMPQPKEAIRFPQQRFAGWNEEVQALLQELDPSLAVHRWRTTDLDPLSALHRGPVVLVWDSGHPMLPFTSQGTTSALVDALRLNSLLAGSDNPESLQDALSRYSASRLQELAPLLQQGRELRCQFLAPYPKAKTPMLPLARFAAAPGEDP